MTLYKVSKYERGILAEEYETSRFSHAFNRFRQAAMSAPAIETHTLSVAIDGGGWRLMAECCEFRVASL